MQSSAVQFPLGERLEVSPEADPVSAELAPRPTPGDSASSPEAAALRPARVRVYLVAAIVDSVTAAYALAVSSLAERELGASPAELGYLGTSFMIAYAVSCLSTAGWSDRKGSRGFTLASLAALAFLVLPLTLLVRGLGVLWVFYLTNALYGLTLSFFWPPFMRQLSLLSPGAILWRTVGAFNIWWSIGMALGSLEGPVLFARLGWAPTIAILAALEAAALLVLVPRMPEPHPAPQVGAAVVADPRGGSLFLHIARIAHFASSFAMGAVSFVFLYVGSRLGLALETIGVILFVKDTGRILAFGGMRILSAWRYSLSWLVAIQCAGGGALILSGFAGEVWHFLALFVVLGLLSGVAYYSSLYYGLDLRSGEGKKSGVHEGILALGFCLGPLVSGWAGGLVPDWPGVVLVVPGAVVLLALALQLVLVLRAREPADGSSPGLRSGGGPAAPGRQGA